MPQTLKELLAERAKLDAEIASRRKTESAQALRTIHELVAEFGFTSQQVFPWKPAAAKKSSAKYLNEKTGQTWSGRGKPPAWIAGKDRSDFLIERPRPDAGPYLAEMAAAADRVRS
ncbi:H-NS family nucleoid-associated regulatory protein [Pseudorhodoferax sp. Leaf265]|uniref:H-NS histone family protein n=1 Tax=Pseudorhodoferax sp. Leaf265 TaxID=1736315 RepID=UPI0006F8A06D|nr:H-NS histone family protein [Pseudorhodoferax sp. Leaf265]KQP03538.1 histone [Pseudorhodoferax sp. Leaf265]